MAEVKTRPTGVPVDEFLATLDERRLTQAVVVRDLMTRVTGVEPVMWGPSIVGYGTMRYDNTTGSYDWPVIGFSPRKGAMTLYGLYNAYAPADPLIDELGPHTTGKSCVYLKKLDGVDLAVLERLIRQAWDRASE